MDKEQNSTAVFMPLPNKTAELKALHTGSDQLPDNMHVREMVIKTYPSLTSDDRSLLLDYADLTQAYNDTAKTDRDTHDYRMQEFARAISEVPQSRTISWLGRFLSVISFGRMNEEKLNKLVHTSCQEELARCRAQEAQIYSEARRLANKDFIKSEQSLFEEGETVLSDSGKALFNRLGDRRETRPRYQLTAQINPAPR